MRGRKIVAGVNRTVLRMYGAKPYQFEPTYPPRKEAAQKKERSASILRHKFQKHPLTPILRRGDGTQILLSFSFLFLFVNHEAQYAKNTFENRFSIP